MADERERELGATFARRNVFFHVYPADVGSFGHYYRRPFGRFAPQRLEEVGSFIAGGFFRHLPALELQPGHRIRVMILCFA